MGIYNGALYRTSLNMLKTTYGNFAATVEGVTQILVQLFARACRAVQTNFVDCDFFWWHSMCILRYSITSIVLKDRYIDYFDSKDTSEFRNQNHTLDIEYKFGGNLPRQWPWLGFPVTH